MLHTFSTVAIYVYIKLKVIFQLKQTQLQCNSISVKLLMKLANSDVRIFISLMLWFVTEKLQRATRSFTEVDYSLKQTKYPLSIFQVWLLLNVCNTDFIANTVVCIETFWENCDNQFEPEYGFKPNSD